MKPQYIILLLSIVILVIQSTSAAGCKSKKKCKKKNGTCFSSSTCSSGFKKITKGCKGKGCSCCAPESQGCQCGQANPNRIVGGQVVSPKYKYPWMVWLQRDGFYQCGGSIINDRYILTAAHCLISYSTCATLKPNSLKVVVADHNKDTTSDDVAVTKTLSVSKVILHSGYDCNLLNDDIGLLRLSKALDLSSQSIQPVCLPADDSKTYVGQTATVTGWGYTTGGGPQLPSLLQEVSLPVIECPDFDEYGEELTPSMLCAGITDGGLDSCNGDSGGPLVVKENNGRYYQVGIVSFGPLDCTGPGIYTRVSKYLTWIDKQMKNAKTCTAGRSSLGAADEPIKILYSSSKAPGMQNPPEASNQKKVNYGH